MVMRHGQRCSWRAGVGWTGAALWLGVWAAASASPARAQGPEPCVYANQNYSHGAIFGGTRCSRGSWINLSETEFRRLYPNGLGSPGAAPGEAAPLAAPVPEAQVAPDAAAAPPPAPPTPAVPAQ